MAQDSKRCFVNVVADKVLPEETLIDNLLRRQTSRIFENVLMILDAIVDGTPAVRVESPSQFSVYTGSGGVAVLCLSLLHMIDQTPPDGYLRHPDVVKHTAQLRQRCVSLFSEYSRCSMSRLSTYEIRNNPRITFLCGASGVHALAAMKAQLAMAENQVRSEVQTVAHLKARKLAILKLLAIYAPYMVADGDPFDDAEKDPKTLCNELLYGKAGYLYSLAFVVDMLRNRPILINGQEDKTATGLITDVQVVMKQVLKAILKEGRRSVTKHKADFSNVPEHYLPCYIWNWHNKPYLGGAHGLCGILNVLLLDEVRSMLPPGTIKKIKQTLVFLLACKLPSGNYPSRHNKPVANGDSDLVQWCHGPTSVALLLCRAAQLPEFVDEKEIYLRVATSAADVIWERGLLRKGVGMCHGISGNAMPFLALYQATGNKQFLYKAGVFADFMLNNAEVTLEAPSDSPYSYSGGLVGAALFLSSLLIPSAAKFPGWDI